MISLPSHELHEGNCLGSMTSIGGLANQPKGQEDPFAALQFNRRTTDLKTQCFTGPQKRCSGPTRIFNTGDRGVARRPRAALHSGPANEALSRLGDRRRGAFEVAFWESRIPTRAREGPCGVPRRRSPRRPRHLRSHRNQTPVFYRAPKGVLRSHQDFQYGQSRRECL